LLFRFYFAFISLLLFAFSSLIDFSKTLKGIRQIVKVFDFWNAQVLMKIHFYISFPATTRQPAKWLLMLFV